MEERLRRERLEAEKKAADLRASKGKTTTKPAISVCDRTEEIKNAIMLKLVKYESRYTHSGQCDLVVVEDLKIITSLSIAFDVRKTIEIKKEDFSDLTSVDFLELSYLNTKALSPDLFSHLTSLRVLNLEHIRFGTREAIGSLPAGIFSGLTSLRLIGIRDVNVSTLPAGIFSGLTALRRIDLEDNRLNPEDFPVGTFSDIGATGTAIVKLHGNLFTPEEQEILKERVKKNTQGRVFISFYQFVWPGQEEQP